MGTLSEILIKVNLFSLGISRILVLFENAELMSVVKGTKKAAEEPALRVHLFGKVRVRGAEALSAVGTLLHFSPGVLLPPLTSWMTRGKLRRFPRPQFPHLPQLI